MGVTWDGEVVPLKHELCQRQRALARKLLQYENCKYRQASMASSVQGMQQEMLHKDTDEMNRKKSGHI